MIFCLIFCRVSPPGVANVKLSGGLGLRMTACAFYNPRVTSHRPLFERYHSTSPQLFHSDAGTSMRGWRWYERGCLRSTINIHDREFRRARPCCSVCTPFAAAYCLAQAQAAPRQTSATRAPCRHPLVTRAFELDGFEHLLHGAATPRRSFARGGLATLARPPARDPRKAFFPRLLAKPTPLTCGTAQWLCIRLLEQVAWQTRLLNIAGTQITSRQQLPRPAASLASMPRADSRWSSYASATCGITSTRGHLCSTTRSRT